MAKRRVIAFLCLAVLGVAGCRVEDPPTRREIEQERKEIRAQRYPQRPKPLPIYNDAQRVFEACGNPANDVIVPLYDKLHNGPTRFMTYRGRQVVTIEYIPYVLVGNGSVVPLRGERVPPNAIWRFQAAHMENREFLTSKHFEIYLPCAAQALADEL